MRLASLADCDVSGAGLAPLNEPWNERSPLKKMAPAPATTMHPRQPSMRLRRRRWRPERPSSSGMRRPSSELLCISVTWVQKGSRYRHGTNPRTHASYQFQKKENEVCFVTPVERAEVETPL
jgi:hypothetical protein